MKILRIIARLNIGGPARNVVLLTKGFSTRQQIFFERDWEEDLLARSNSIIWETVLVCGEVSEGEGDMMYLASEKGIDPVIVKELGRELSVRNDWRAFWKIYRIICREKPDIVHTHTAKAGALGRAAVLLYNARQVCSKPKIFSDKLNTQGSGSNRAAVVHTFHGHVLHSYFGKSKTRFFIWVEKVLALFTDRIISVSESLERELIEKFRIAPEKKFSVVELGFELDELLKLPVKEESDCVNIGIVGRLARVKNHRMLFRVASRIKDSGLRIKFVVVGDGELRQDLEDCARGLGIEDIVEFKGWVRDLKEIYRELDIVTLTSLNEGTPVSIIEGMAAARPVVATEAGGVSDIVQDGRGGYLVKLNDDKGFLEKLLDLVRDAEKRKRFGREARELVKERFSKERLIGDMEALYTEVSRAE